MTSYTNPTLKPAESTTVGVRIDRLLDEISFLKDKLKRATLMVEDMTVSYTESNMAEVAFDFTEVMLVLVETRIDADERRWPTTETQEPVLVLTGTETKEDNS